MPAKDASREESKREAIQSAAVEAKKEVTEVFEESLPAEFEPAEAYGDADDVAAAEVVEKEAKA